jgi:exopolysaccharide biosynthesis polyprenyl glycosylphosphotransferase
VPTEAPGAASRPHRRTHHRRSILIVGTSAPALRFAASLADADDLGLEVDGFLGPREQGAALGPRYLGEVERLQSVLHERAVDEVGICLPPGDTAELEKACEIAMTEGKALRVRSDIPLPQLAANSLEHRAGESVLVVRGAPSSGPALAAKRALDIVGASLGLILLSPLFAAVAVGMVVTQGRPVVFRQTRAGRHGRLFQVVKFRTMTQDADAQRTALRQYNEVSGNASFKMTNDPRITPIGRFLRRTSIDELPQLWNVLRGEMSLVGPRPHPLDDVAGYELWHHRRLAMKPGITGLWQVAGRRDADFDRWTRYDLEYIDRWSLGLDVQLLVKTIPAMLRAEGR